LSISVSIVDDDPKVRAMLVAWIATSAEFRFVSECSSAESALAKLPVEKPEVVLMDINLAGKSGIDCVRTLKAKLPEIQFLMLTVFEDGDHIFDALTAGASGYLLKRTPREELLAGIRQVWEGGSPMTSYIARKVVQWFQTRNSPRNDGLEELSAREREILRLLARGYAYKEMTSALGISLGTINTHVRRIYQKLHVRSRGEAISRFAPLPPEMRPH
jgi:DNA-binding NarL/FixJ family response regulator